jgi:cold shock CspA family protein
MGTLTTWKRPANYGFIRQNSGAEDAYLHISDVLNPPNDHLNEGCYVEYDIVPQPDRPKAVRVVVLENEE